MNISNTEKQFLLNRLQHDESAFACQCNLQHIRLWVEILEHGLEPSMDDLCWLSDYVATQAEQLAGANI